MSDSKGFLLSEQYRYRWWWQRLWCRLMDHAGITPVDHDGKVWRCKRCGGLVDFDE